MNVAMTRNATLKISLNRLVCTTCGSQYENSFSSTSITSTFVSAADLLCPLDTCRICDDPRQFVPPSGQSFTTLELLWKSEKYRNVFEKVKEDEKVIEMWTEPKVGEASISERTQPSLVIDALSPLVKKNEKQDDQPLRDATSSC
jgi:hypothetical protein